MRPWLPLLVLPLALGSCAHIQRILAAVPDDVKPKVTFEGASIDRVDFDGFDATFTFGIDNPNPLGITVKAFAYDLDLEGVGLLDGTRDEGLAIAARGKSTVGLPAGLQWREAVDLSQATKGKDELGFRVRGSFSFDTPSGPVTLPYDHSGTVPAVRAPQVKPAALRAKKVDLLSQTATLELDLDVTHTGGGAMTLERFEYGIALGGTEVADGQVATLATVADGATETVTLPLNLRLVKLGTAIIDAIARKQPVQVGLRAGTAVRTPLGAIPLDVSETVTLRVK